MFKAVPMKQIVRVGFVHVRSAVEGDRATVPENMRKAYNRKVSEV